MFGFEGTANVLAGNDFFTKLLEFASSGYAILIYAIVLLVILTLVVVTLLVRDRKRAGGGAADAEGPVQVSVVQNTLGKGGRSAEEGEELPSEEGASRFDGLTRIDRERMKYEKEGYDEHITLRTVCERFRNFAAGRLKLYYSEADIRRFIAGLLTSHIMILQGMSGTGKTSLAYAFGEFLDNPSTVVPVQPMWKERTDLIGYYNEFTKRFNETDLLKKMYEANYSRDIYITVLDEMNIARVEYYFAEFLSLLELPNAGTSACRRTCGSWGRRTTTIRRSRFRTRYTTARW